MDTSWQERELSTRTHGRYLVRPCPGRPRPPLLVCFHGYAQGAEEPLEALGQVDGLERWLVCSIQGLHRFYRTRTGDVVASWMTRQARARAIEDNLRYVTGVIEEVRREFDASERLVLLGFSQGVAMAYRTAVRSGLTCHGLVALGGDVPPELCEDPTARFPPLLIGRGTGDEWYGAQKMKQDLDALARHAAVIQTCVFEGGHEWAPAFVDATGRFLAGLAD